MTFGTYPGLSQCSLLTVVEGVVRVRDLVLKMSMSLDGFVAGPGGELDWQFRSRSEDSTAWVLQTLSQAGLHVMGRRTYDGMIGYWPTASGPMAAAMNEIPKVVFTRQETLRHRDVTGSTAEGFGWDSPRIANGELAEEVRRLKEEPGDYVLAHGGSLFARSLIRLGLVDEYRLLIHPAALGSGLALFADLGEPADLRLVDATAFSGGVVAHVYRPAGT
ncbi:dihydrofolate reductase family protein [Gordonia sp. DT219]|uniref:dihydrofolate reductase family protein n=1 Tax=Gordonia sp. DT219 TaxID=3416658 RepID=UPI003CFB8E7E